MAFGLAAYVSRIGFPPTRKAGFQVLVTLSWAGFHPQGSDKRFQLTSCRLSSSSKLLGTIKVRPRGLKTVELPSMPPVGGSCLNLPEMKFFPVRPSFDTTYRYIVFYVGLVSTCKNSEENRGFHSLDCELYTRWKDGKNQA